MIDNNTLIQAKEILEDQSIKLTVALIAAVISLIVGILNIYFNRKNHKEQLEEKRRDERRKEISKALNEFYGPFQQYLNISKELFKLLRKGKPKGFRTLDYLINKETLFPDENNHTSKALLTKVDEEILSEIIEIGSKLESLIVEKAGLVDDVVLRYNYTSNPSITDVTLNDNGLLAIAKTHFQIIRLASTGRLTEESERFKNYVFPRELPLKIEEKIIQLQKELKSPNS